MSAIKFVCILACEQTTTDLKYVMNVIRINKKAIGLKVDDKIRRHL